MDGKAYDVTVEMDDEPLPASGSHGGPAAAPPPAIPSSASASVVSAPLAPSPAPAATTGSGGASEPGDVPSPLAGRVTAVNVQAGQDVKEGDHLITLEAMKMNTFVIAPRTGKVKAVKVTVGVAVEEGQALVTLG